MKRKPILTLKTLLILFAIGIGVFGFFIEDYREWSSKNAIDSYWACQSFEEDRMENWEEHCAESSIRSWSPYFFERFD